jgi:hypothetical protein
MKTKILNTTAQILVDQLLKKYNGEISVKPMNNFHENGFIAVYVQNDGEILGATSVSIHGAEIKDTKSGTQYLVNRISKLYNASLQTYY